MRRYGRVKRGKPQKVEYVFFERLTDRCNCCFLLAADLAECVPLFLGGFDPSSLLGLAIRAVRLAVFKQAIDIFILGE